MQQENKTPTGYIKDIAAPATLGDVMLKLNENDSGLDRVRNTLALRMNQYNDIVMTQMDVKRLAKAFQSIEVGTATNLILICSRDKCLYQNRCPFYEDDRCPEGKECIHENYMLTYYMNQYIQSLEVDIENMPEMVLINQLVEYELLEYRCNTILSNSHTDLKWTKIIGLDKDGNIIESDEISYALTIKDKVQEKKLRVLQELTATRKEKYKKQAALKETKDDPAKIISQLKKQITDKRKENIDIDEIKENLTSPLLDEEIYEYEEGKE